MKIARIPASQTISGHAYEISYTPIAAEDAMRDEIGEVQVIWGNGQAVAGGTLEREMRPTGGVRLYVDVPVVDAAQIAAVVAGLAEEYEGARTEEAPADDLPHMTVAHLRGLFGLLSAQGTEVWSLGARFTPPGIEGAEPLTSLIWVCRSEEPRIRVSLDLSETGAACVVGQGATVGEAQADAWRLYQLEVAALMDDVASDHAQVRALPGHP